MLTLILALSALAVLAPLLVRVAGRWIGWLLAVVPAAGFVFFATLLPLDLGEHHLESWTWFPALGVEMSFAVDGLSLLFALLVTGIGALVVLYSGGYLEGDKDIGRFFSGLLVFMAAMLGVVLSDNLIALFVFWELTGIASYFLISHKNKSEENRNAALQALLITGAGGLALLCGFILLALAGVDLGAGGPNGGLASAMTLSSLSEVDVRQHAYYTPAVILILVGVFTKSAQFPFHSWLPAAMAAPTPASSYLHSATMVKAGVYLVARLQPELGGTWLWTLALVGAGFTTMLLGVIIGLRQRDLKRLLAYSTLAVLGTLTMLIGVGTEGAVDAALVLLLAHALYKASLFMMAGNVDHGSGTRDIALLGGLRLRMPGTAVAAVVAAASMAGLVPMLGFIAKDLLYASKLDLPTLGFVQLILALVANMLMVAIALLVSVKPFFGPPSKTSLEAHEAPFSMLAGPVGLAFLGLFLGLIPNAFGKALGSAAATAVRGEATPMKLALWHGVNFESLFVLGLSIATLVGGWLVFVWERRRLPSPSDAAPLAEQRGPSDRVYDAFLSGMYGIAGRFAATIQNGHLPGYITVVVVVAASAIALPLWMALRGPLAIDPIPLDPSEIGIALAIVAGAVGAAILRTHLAAIAALGASGLGIAMVFAIYGAPDLALTLLLVEVLTVLVLVLVFRRLPTKPARSPVSRKLRDGLIAMTCGAVMMGLTLVSAAVHLPADASRFFADASVPEGKGQNVVNVILVDFRALDTLGEIVVVAVAGLGVLAMLRSRRPKQVTDQTGDRSASDPEVTT